MIFEPFWALGASLGLLGASMDTKVVPGRPQRGSGRGFGVHLGRFWVPPGPSGILFSTIFHSFSLFFGGCFFVGFWASFLMDFGSLFDTFFDVFLSVCEHPRAR